MEIYLVGGAVRDELLGLPCREKDWVVTGATTEEMLRLGYRQVGRDFPVFLHPDTGEEHALARTERKTAAGYRGFEVHAAPDVTLEDDLMRRDLRINAIAKDQSGAIIDPFGGRADIEDRLLRHVSDAFGEDPVRILRVARFAARFAEQDFAVADETMALMCDMVDKGEVNALVPERVWQETRRALETGNPEIYFEVLGECGALHILFPEIDALFGVEQKPGWHPEIDCGIHTLMALRMAARLSGDPIVRFAALVHDLGKGNTPADILPGHAGHERRSVELIAGMGSRLRIPNDYLDLAGLVARFHGHSHRAEELRPSTMLKLIEATDAFRRPQRLEDFLTACEADYRGRKDFESRPYPQAALIRRMAEVAARVTAASIDTAGLAGEQIGERLREARCAAIKSARREQG